MSNRAVIYIPATAEAMRVEREEEGARYCAEQHYDVVSVVAGEPEGDRWRDVRDMASRDMFDVLVVVDRDDLPPARRPRIEIVRDPSTWPTAPRDAPTPPVDEPEE
jgi:hypothetical protein